MWSFLETFLSMLPLVGSFVEKSKLIHKDCLPTVKRHLCVVFQQTNLIYPVLKKKHGLNQGPKKITRRTLLHPPREILRASTQRRCLSGSSSSWTLFYKSAHTAEQSQRKLSLKISPQNHPASQKCQYIHPLHIFQYSDSLSKKSEIDPVFSQ